MMKFQFLQILKKEFNKELEKELAEQAGTDNLKVVKSFSKK